jgi:hexulose-6-phosphate isomerase
MLFVPGVVDSSTYYDDAYRNSLSVLKWELAPFAEDIGVTIAIEYVWNKFLLSPMEFAEYVDEVESSNVGLFFDTGNMVVFGFPEQWVKINSYRVKMVHFKDFKRDGWGWPPLLEGDVDFPAVMRELRAIEYDDAVISEVPPGVASLEDTAGAIRRILEM